MVRGGFSGQHVPIYIISSCTIYSISIFLLKYEAFPETSSGAPATLSLKLLSCLSPRKRSAHITAVLSSAEISFAEEAPSACPCEVGQFWHLSAGSLTPFGTRLARSSFVFLYVPSLFWSTSCP